jgi:exodeoxyribonuclease V alpha subunit
MRDATSQQHTSAGNASDTFDAQLDHWVADGWLRPLDRALARFLRAEGGEHDILVLTAAALVSQQLGTGHICVNLNDIQAHPERFAAATVDDKGGPALALSAHPLETLIDRLQRSTAADTGAGNAPLVLDGQRLYLRRYWHYETQVAATVQHLLSETLPVPDDLQNRLQNLFQNHTSEDQPDWQKVACALAVRGRLTIITGGPGTGKTTTVVRLLGLLQQAAVEAGQPLRIRLAAPTGKAAARLTESIGAQIHSLPLDKAVIERLPAEVTTLHRLLGSRPDSRQFRFNLTNPLHADLVVVDEASMIDLEMMASLLEALPPHARLVLLGDKDQLASVEAGAVMADLCLDASNGGYDEDTAGWLGSLCEADLTPWSGAARAPALARQTAMLRYSHRFGADSGIGRLARAVNQADAAAVDALWREAPEDIARMPLAGIDDDRLDQLCIDGYQPFLRHLQPEPTALSEDAAIELARVLLEDFSRFRLLCALRSGPAGVQGLNRRIAEALHAHGFLTRSDGWYPGRPVMVTRNDYQLGLINGDIGICINVADEQQRSRLRVAFPQTDNGIRLILPSRLSAVESAWAMTVHKSQGSEFQHTALVLPPTDNPVVSRELLYTAITRASQKFSVLLPNQDVWNRAVARNTWRSSGLAERLAEAGR